MRNIGASDGEFKARWIRVHVSIFDHHEIFGDEPYCQRSAWLWLIANAAWKDKRVNHKGNILELKRGQVLVGRAFLAQQWKWSEKKVRNFLALLASDNMLEMGQSKGHYANVATICNYGKYQDVPNREGRSQGQSGASEGPERGQTYTKNTNLTTTTKTDISSPLASTCEDAARGRAKTKFDFGRAATWIAERSTLDYDDLVNGFEDLADEFGDDIACAAFDDFKKNAKFYSLKTFRKFCETARDNPRAIAPNPTKDDPRTVAWRNSPWGREAAARRAKGALQ